MKATSRKIEQRVEKATSILSESAQNANALGFSTRVLVQASLPHRQPSPERNSWIRTNGNYSLIVQPGIDSTGDSIGFPFGNIPRLVLAYLTTNVVKTGNREVELGGSLSAFMRDLGMHSNGRDIRRIKDQMHRLFSASITFRCDAQDSRGSGAAHRPIAKDFQLWWDTHSTAQDSLFRSYVRLDEDFHREILEHPVPIDLRAIQYLKQSSLALDLYTWLNHRMNYLSHRTRVPWYSIAQHIGSEYKSIHEFRRWAKQALSAVQSIWPELRLGEEEGALILHPSRPHIEPKRVQVLLPDK